MKKHCLYAVPFVLFSSLLFGTTAVSAESNWQGDGTISFDGEYGKDVLDPENPGNIVDPGPSPSTDGLLRIEFVPQLNFWNNKISSEDQTYAANAQLFHSDTGPRGNFVQVSDYRGTGAGWTLQLRQETQFKNETTTNKELTGAVISMDKSWVNSTFDLANGPAVSKDVIRIDNIGQTYTLAEAKKGTGEGTWSLEFGASIENQSGQADTLSPRLDKDGNPISDADFGGQPIYENSAVTLFVPGKTKKDPVQYQTVLTWILSELP
ncbi:WxL domain-containing protein [Enterococcus sp. LJL128]|uniref:WxL domain-containing protein n=1 Tax=Enterococcus sp. LJL51 TaxID=3416656 RepID=UPI003CF4A606